MAAEKLKKGGFPVMGKPPKKKKKKTKMDKLFALIRDANH
jgi:hypothetical protein